MLHTLAVANYRSLRDVVVPLGPLTLITGPNGSGKSNLYRAIRLLSEAASGAAIASLAAEGGLGSAMWAGPETFARAVKRGELPVQGGPRKDPARVRLGFAGDDFGYAIEFGPPVPVSGSAFNKDPEIKREGIWHGGAWRASSALVDRKAQLVKTRDGREWTILSQQLQPFDSMLTQLADPQRAPEILALRDSIRSWRFYDHFRTDAHAPARQAQIGTRTPVLSHDGRDLAAALQTIREIGDGAALDAAVADAFDGARVEVCVTADNRFALEVQQHGLLRGLGQAELSDGTLRYLLLIAALLTPRPPALMVLNEPETSLHPDLTPALARLIEQAAKQTQLWVVSHSERLVAELAKVQACTRIVLTKEMGETVIEGQSLLTKPTWAWMSG